MKTFARSLAFVLLAVPAASATELLYSTGWSNYTTVQSVACGSPASVLEAADDFDLVASIERVYVTGYNSCIASCFPPPVSGARVRFYAWTATGPGALQSEQFVPAGSPGFLYDPTDIESLDVALPQAFAASGKHYVSVQLEFASCFYWAYWIANKDNPIGGAAYSRSNGGAWSKVTAFNMLSSDLSFSLYGTLGGPAPHLGCGVWSVEPSPNAPGMNQTWLNDMAYVAADDIWAVGRSYGPGSTPGDDNQYTFALHFDGSQWSVVPTPSPNPVADLTYCELSAVAALAPNDVWAAGTRLGADEGAGYIGTHNLVLHWNGSSWQVMDAPIPASFGLQGVSGDGIYEILALAPNDIWFLGEWIRMNAQGFTFRHALAMHYDGSNFTVDETFPIVGSNGATIYASDALGPDDIWAVGAAGDGDPAPAAHTFIFHWDGSDWSHVPAGSMPGVYHTFGGVKMLATDDVWISGSSWAPPNVVTQFMLHWDGSGYEFIEVPYAGGMIVGEPPAMYVFGSGGVSLFDGETFTDAHLLEGLEGLTGYGFGAVEQTGPCEMLAVGSKSAAGDAKTLVARLDPLAWSNLGHGKAGSRGLPVLSGSGSLAALSSNLLDLAGAAPASIATLVVGLSAVDLPFLGGTLVPNPQVLVPLPTSAEGGAALPFVLPVALPAATSLYFQFWIADPGAASGLSASNGVQGSAN